MEVYTSPEIPMCSPSTLAALESESMYGLVMVIVVSLVFLRVSDCLFRPALSRAKFKKKKNAT
jgi:hypothetical protein